MDAAGGGFPRAKAEWEAVNGWEMFDERFKPPLVGTDDMEDIPPMYMDDMPGAVMNCEDMPDIGDICE